MLQSRNPVCAVAAMAILGGAVAAYGQSFEIPVDQAASSVTVDLCVLSKCDTDSSAVSGSSTIELDDPTSPTQITLHDFELSLVDNLDLFIRFNIGPIELGSLDVTGTGLGFSYANAGTPLGPVTIVDNAFSFLAVQAATVGIISYEADGIVCDVIEGSGLPCVDEIDTAGEVQEAEFSGVLTVADGIATLSSSIALTIPFDPKNPDTGTLTLEGTVTGSAAVPPPPPTECDADANGDGVVDPLDSGYASARLGCAVGTGDAACDAADANGDGVVDPLDIGFIAARFGDCP